MYFSRDNRVFGVGVEFVGIERGVINNMKQDWERVLYKTPDCPAHLEYDGTLYRDRNCKKDEFSGVKGSKFCFKGYATAKPQARTGQVFTKIWLAEMKDDDGEFIILADVRGEVEKKLLKKEQDNIHIRLKSTKDGYIPIKLKDTELPHPVKGGVARVVFKVMPERIKHGDFYLNLSLCRDGEIVEYDR